MNRDRRYRHTEEKLREACLALSRKKDIHRLTVTEVCREADINRITFYDHYETIDQLVDRMETEYITRANEQMEPFTDFWTEPEKIMKRMMAFYRDEKNPFGRRDMNVRLMDKAIDAIIERVLARKNGYSPEERQRVTFAINGIRGVFLSGALNTENGVRLAASIVRTVITADSGDGQ